MSSAAAITFEPDTIGVPADEWRTFCTEHDIAHSPQTVGGNVYYMRAVEVHYTRRELRFSTAWGDEAIPQCARLAMIAWCRWGGEISADPEIRRSVYKGPRP